MSRNNYHLQRHTIETSTNNDALNCFNYQSCTNICQHRDGTHHMQRIYETQTDMYSCKLSACVQSGDCSSKQTEVYFVVPGFWSNPGPGCLPLDSGRRRRRICQSFCVCSILGGQVGARFEKTMKKQLQARPGTYILGYVYGGPKRLDFIS